MSVVSVLTEDGRRIASIDDIVPGSTVLVSSCDTMGQSPPKNPPSPVSKKSQIMSADSFARLFGTNEPQSQCQDVTEKEPGVFSFADKTTPKKEPRQKPRFVSQRKKEKEEQERKAREELDQSLDDVTSQEEPEQSQQSQGRGSRQRRRSQKKGLDSSPERSLDSQSSPSKERLTPVRENSWVSTEEPESEQKERTHHRKRNSEGPKCRLQSKPRIQMMIEEEERKAMMEEEEEPEPVQEVKRRRHRRHRKQEEAPAAEETNTTEGLLSDGEDEEEKPATPSRSRSHHRRHRKGGDSEQQLTDEEKPASAKKGIRLHHRGSKKAEDSEQQLTDELADDEVTDEEKPTSAKPGIRIHTRSSKKAEDSELTDELADDEVEEKPTSAKKGIRIHRRDSKKVEDSELTDEVADDDASPKRTMSIQPKKTKNTDESDETPKKMIIQRKSNTPKESFHDSEVMTTEEQSYEEPATPTSKTRRRRHRKANESPMNTSNEQTDEESEEKPSLGLKIRSKKLNKTEDSEYQTTEEYESEEKPAPKGMTIQTKAKKNESPATPKRTMVLQQKSPATTDVPTSESESKPKKTLALRPSGSKSSAVKSEAKTSEEPSYYDDDYDYDESDEKPVKEKSSEKAGPQIMNAETMEDMFKVLLGDTSIETKIEDGLETLPRFKEVLKTLPSMEGQQGTMWFEKALEFASTQGLESLGDDAFYIDDMIGHARAVLVDRRFNTGTSFSHRHNIGVIGPRQSGKSVFLRVLADEILVDLAATDEWKKTFVFIADLAPVCSLAHDFAEFYNAIVALTFKQLEWQRPHFAKHLKMIQAYFSSIPFLACPPKFTKAFVVEEETRALALKLQKIADTLSALWHDPSGLVQWITNVVTFPSTIAKAFDFTKTLTILDHFDACDVSIVGHPDVFEDSKEVVFLADIFKFVLRIENFILACQDQERFYSILPAISGDENCCLKDHIELVSTIGLVPEQDDARQFLVSFTGETSGYPFTIDACGGVPFFLQIWEELNKMFDDVESDDGDKAEKQISMNAYMQEFMKILFQINTGDQPFEVTSITRTNRKAKSK